MYCTTILLITMASKLILLTAFCLLISQTRAQSAPAPAPDGPLNLTGILDKGNQFTTFLRLLTQTQAATQIQSQLNSSTEGMTVFAPTDNAFNNLKAGALNELNTTQQVQLVQYHVLPKYYTLASLLTVSNPVRTLATGQDGGVYGLNFTGSGNQVNVSTGVVETQINNALRQQFPLALYPVDKVLLPNELFGVKPLAPPAAKTPVGSPNATATPKEASAPESANDSSKKSVGFMGLVLGVCLLFLGGFS